MLGVGGQGGNARFELIVPNLLGLVGRHSYNQAIGFDPAANNAAGVVVSDAAEAVIGR
ncbi:MAG: hypothetical protein KDE27_26820 [Planctomycetes bacterium]|nr:hypothetical protein [Planctomycetota bacterium]